jgi:chromate reductase
MGSLRHSLTTSALNSRVNLRRGRRSLFFSEMDQSSCIVAPFGVSGKRGEIQLIFESMGFPSPLSGKLIALLGVAAGRIGAFKSLEQLRSVCAHTEALVLPSPVSIAGINRLFDEQSKLNDVPTEQAIASVATNLLEYLNHNVCPRYTLEALMRGTAPSACQSPA